MCWWKGAEGPMGVEGLELACVVISVTARQK
jgi:hypothetical protein